MTSTTTADDEYDLLVIGGGSGGVRAARISAGYGVKVGLIEPQLQHGPPRFSAIGGTCVNVGCVPKKLMVFASHYPEEVASAAGYGWEGATAGTFNWDYFMEQKNKEITRLNNIYADNILKKAGVEIIEGFGTLNGTNAVDVKMTATGETKTLKAKNILISVGGWPFKPKTPGIEHAITSNEIFYLKEQPKRLVVVGGGYIALEFANIMAGLGTKVTVIYRGELFLRGFDMDMRLLLKEEMGKNPNIDIQFKKNPKEIIKNADGTLKVTTDCGMVLETDAIMYATGRVGCTDKLNLESAGVETKGSFIPVDDYSKTNVPGIYAVGDITDRIALTPVALMEGHRLADTIFGGKDRPVDHEFVASVVFTNPEIGTIGYTEEDAVKKFKNISVYKTKFKAMKVSFPGGHAQTMFKLIIDDNTGKVIGCHLGTTGAGEMLQGVAVAIKMGATKDDFDNTIGIHPTSAEELVTMRTPAYTYKDGAKVEK
jgi:glutathione reductase (NADPH)